MGTSAVAAVVVDVVRLIAYGLSFRTGNGLELPAEAFGLVAAAMLCAFAGAFLGARLLKKVTLRFVRITVAGLMVVIGSGLAGGLL